jgi:hypothetical protein
MMTTSEIAPNGSCQLRSCLLGISKTSDRHSPRHRLYWLAVAFGILPKCDLEFTAVDRRQLSLQSRYSYGGQFDGGRNPPICSHWTGQAVEQNVNRLDPVESRRLAALNTGEREGMGKGHRRAPDSLFHRGHFQWCRRLQARILPTGPERGRLCADSCRWRARPKTWRANTRVYVAIFIKITRLACGQIECIFDRNACHRNWLLSRTTFFRNLSARDYWLIDPRFALTCQPIGRMKCKHSRIASARQTQISRKNSQKRPPVPGA